MLTAEIKQIINNARDILVGKVPDPKSQVDLITTAMIYKFMDDMDIAGQRRVFFVGDMEKYAFSKIMDVKQGAQQRLNLYAEALEKLPFAASIPELFRKIFKDAFLPFRDPNTLTMFLREIAKFNYDNSENLGNAFEYLLSVMGSQGDAGQFRTPRHIIDFMVNVVQPTKDDTILDPACGTAGFLISAYLYIKKNNPEMSAKEIRQLTENITGYDISPDMVKLATVNMYLHQFNQPKIYEYDSLSDDSRWGDSFDCILANPPFMTPKGGIVPHSKFQVKANKAEVLFVDYIIEHLNINGCAGIVVPEGIVSTKDTAFRKLRKLLVEDNYLYAIVSLPRGVFNPYSGVKTYILFIDRKLAKERDEILFVRVDNDGFDLGAKRQHISENDLPVALEIIQKWKNLEDISDYPQVDIVSKNQIKNLEETVTKTKEKTYNLTVSRYKEHGILEETEYPKIKLSDLLEYEQPTNYIVKSVEYKDSYKTPVLTANQSFILGYTNETEGIFTKTPVIIFDDFTTDIKYVNFPFKVKSSAMKILKNKDNNISDIRYIYQVMRGIKINTETHKRYWISEYSNIEIPLPPLEIQKQIVAEIENKQQAIDNAREIIRNLERERELILPRFLKE